MDAIDLEKFNDGIRLAQAGKKGEAYQRFRALLINNPNDANLFLWIAFSSPDATESQRAIREAIKIDPTNQNLQAAKDWFNREKRKELPQFSTQTEPKIQPTAAYNAPKNEEFQYQAYQNVNYSTPPSSSSAQVYSNVPPGPQIYQNIPPISNFNYNNNYFIPNRIVKNWLYGLPGFGALVLFISAFLPWVQAGYLNLEISMNGLGMLSGSPVLIGGLQRAGNMPGVKDGVFFLGLSLIVMLFSIIGFVRNRIKTDWVIVVLGFVALGLSLFEIIDTTKRMAEINMGISNDAVGGSIGMGITVALIGSIITIISGFTISAGSVFFRPKY